MSVVDAVEARIEALEIKLADSEDTIDALNTSVYRQQQQIDLLQEQLRVLRQQFNDSLPGEARSLRDEIPPHY